MTTNRQFLTNGRNRYSIKFNSTKPINQTLPKFAIASYVSIFIGYFINVSNLMQCTKIYATQTKKNSREIKEVKNEAYKMTRYDIVFIGAHYIVTARARKLGKYTSLRSEVPNLK